MRYYTTKNFTLGHRALGGKTFCSYCMSMLERVTEYEDRTPVGSHYNCSCKYAALEHTFLLTIERLKSEIRAVRDAIDDLPTEKDDIRAMKYRYHLEKLCKEYEMPVPV